MLMTVKDLANMQGVSERWIRMQIAELGIEPEVDNNMNYVVHKIGPGRPELFYDSDVFLQQIEKRSDLKVAKQLSDQGKLKFIIGHIELEGTAEERERIRLAIDNEVAAEVKQIRDEYYDLSHELLTNVTKAKSDIEATYMRQLAHQRRYGL
jgi:hypothetical protein